MELFFRDREALGRPRSESSGRISFSSGGGGGGSGGGGCLALPSPFGKLGCTLSVAELRETAYELLVAACRSAGRNSKVSPSERSTSPVPLSSAAAVPPLQRSLSSTANRVKKALELKPARKGAVRSGSPLRLQRRPASVEELVRVQMGVSEQADSRIRKGLLRITAGQLGKHVESMVLPLELLQLFKSTDFPDQLEYEAWKFRNLKVLEAGLLIHPYLPIDKSDISSQRLRKIICEAAERPIETGRISESMQALQSAVMTLACRSIDGSVAETCHWADGNPLNLHLYQRLLETCFENNKEGSLVEEIDEVIDLIRNTWIVLGINKKFHNLCFLSVLFQFFIATGQVGKDLLLGVGSYLTEVSRDAKSTKEPLYWEILGSTLSSIMKWAEKRLLAYHDTFGPSNIYSMHIILSLNVLAAEILSEDISQEYFPKRRGDGNVAQNMVDGYIRSSLRAAFAQRVEKADSSSLSKADASSTPILSILAADVDDLANKEKGLFSPILKKWHALAAGVAVATLHACYGNELKKFLKSVPELTNDSAQVLEAADILEKKLVLIAVEDSVDSEDGGKAIIREMPPYETQLALSNMAKSWTETRIERLKEWVSRNLQQEAWSPRANKENIAPSAVEVLRTLDETSEAFFRLPIRTHRILLPELVTGLDKRLQQYILKARSGCGTRNSYIPALPVLTRCETGFKLWRKKLEKPKDAPRRRSQVAGTTNGHDSFGLPQLCVRINTMQHIKTELGNLEKKLRNFPRSSESAQEDVQIKFGQSLAACQEGILHLCESTGYKVIFNDLSHVLWDGLYTGDAASSRIDSFLRELEPNLEIISTLVHDKVRNGVLTALMKAAFDGFLFVLLAGGPSRAFSREDSQIVEDDFWALKDLFLADGDGLPADLVEQASVKVRNVLPLFRTDTECLIEWFKWTVSEKYGPNTKTKYPLPPTTGQWSPTDANTLLRVLCCRNDEAASRFLKKSYNFPTNL